MRAPIISHVSARVAFGSFVVLAPLVACRATSNAPLPPPSVAPATLPVASASATPSASASADANLPLAIVLYKRACDAKSAHGCVLLGLAYANGPLVSIDDAKAVSYFDRACKLGSPGGCGNLGIMLETGSGIGKDVARAEHLYEKSCDGGWSSGCARLGNLLWSTNDGADQPAAVEAYRKGCDIGNGGACSSLGYAYDEGKGIAADAALSVKAYRRGCDLESPNACVGLASVYMRGRGGVTKDLKRATELFETACKLGSSYADYVYGVRLSDGSLGAVDDEHAAELLKRACDAEEGDACTELAGLVEQGRAH